MPTSLSHPPIAVRPSASDAALAAYAELKARVREALILGQQRIEAAKVITYWRTGWYIRTHIKLHAGRAEYGARVVERLSRDLEVHKSVLHRCVQFVERLPKLLVTDAPIVAGRRQSSQRFASSLDHPAVRLTWTHYRALLTVSDARQREALLQQAARQEWSSTELETRIRRTAARNGQDRTAPASRRLTPLRGTPGLFQIKDVAGTCYWDLGFESYRELSSTQARAFKAGDLVQLTADGALEPAPKEATPANLYTYEARILRVVDGDTLWLLIHLGGADWRKEKLRLRGIDCPEMGTSAGEAAKRYVQAQLQRTTRLTITTTKPDQWDRYLSDVFLTTATGEEIFLNNRLLETGHARLYAAVSLKDWEG